MSDVKKLKFAVISDPHVYNGPSGDSCPSWIAMGDDQSNPRQNPFSGLKKLIESAELTADFVICGGDLGDKAVPQAQQYAWNEIQSIASLLGASEVIGAAGNHDIDSRFSHTDFDAKGQVLALKPTFPVARKENWLEYWARNFTVFESCGIRFLLLNSSAFHGAQKKDANPEFEQGRVSDRTLDAIFTDSRLSHEVSVNILICHHHPMKNEKIKISDYSQMENGDQLVNKIEKHDQGPWLVIHGHKHLPRIYYAPGGNSAATIFSAGSFAAKPYPEIQEFARNEFYMLEVDVPIAMSSTTVKGRVHVWQWSYGNGWIVPHTGAGLGPSAAFGTKLDTYELAEQIASHFKTNNPGEPITWALVVQEFPKISFLIPDDLSKLSNRLSQSHQIKVLRNELGEIAELQVPR